MSVPQQRVSVVYVDDDDYVRYALKLMLDDPEIEVLAACATRRECIEAVTRYRPQVALVDMLLAGDPAAGVAVIREIREISPTTVCAVLTSSAEHGEYLLQSMQAGAEAYYSKGYAKGPRLPEIVKGLAQGNYEPEPRYVERLTRFAQENRQAQAQLRNRPEQELTAREREVLGLIAEGCKPQEIARRLFITEDTVKTHKQHITRKLGLNSQTLLVVYAVLRKYLLQHPDDAHE